MTAPAAYIKPFRDMLPPNARLLVQAGGASGELARDYRALYPAASLLVVEADPATAQQARSYTDRVHLADLDTASPAFYRQLEMADGWYFDTTLEQLHDPLQVLRQVRKVIQFDASIVARISNRLHWDVAAPPPRHPWSINDILSVFQQAGLRVVSGVLLNPTALPAKYEAVLRQQAAQLGQPAETLIDAAQPSHYLIKAVPA